MKLKKFFEYIFSPKNGLSIFMAAVGLVYGLIPLIIFLFFRGNEAFGLLAAITGVALISMWLGACIPIFDFRFSKTARCFRISPEKFIFFSFFVFLIFLVITFATAPTVPILSALNGAESNDLSAERGAFLKGREGAELILLYMSTFLVNTIVPYSIVLLYERGSSKRYLATFLFFIFCISFMQKSLFLNCLLPILAFLADKRRLNNRILFLILAGAFSILMITTYLSLRGEQMDQYISEGGYFSASYAPHSPFEYFLWRSVSVPVFTATDTLIVHEEQFRGNNLWGATSSFISGIFGLERINIERYVFEYQFGSWNEVANANAVFIIDAFVNFGWLGVILFGVFVGLVFRWFRLSDDVAFRSLWTIFAFVLFSAPLIGMLLSNGFAYMLFHALFIRVKKYEISK